MRSDVAGLLCAVGVGLTGCGGSDEDSDSRVDQNDDIKMLRMRLVEAQVKRGELPPVTTRLFRLDGSVDFRTIGGPKGDDHVVRSSADGTRGPKLRWDLDQNGRIDPNEREITARDLYDATLPAYDEAQRRVISGDRGPKA